MNQPILTAHGIRALAQLPQHNLELGESQAHTRGLALWMESPALEGGSVGVDMLKVWGVEPALDGRIGEVDQQAWECGVLDAPEAQAL